MMSPPAGLTLDAVREWVGDFEVGKGRPYADGPAVVGPRVEGDGHELRAHVRGSRARPYPVVVRLDTVRDGKPSGRVVRASCQCPVGDQGRCKHVAAVLLTYLDDPERFTPVAPIGPLLAGREREELVGLVETLLAFAPDLKPLLALPVPGFVCEPVSPELFRRKASEVIQAARSGDEWSEVEVMNGLEPVLTLGRRYLTGNNTEAAEAVTEGLVRALRESGLDRARLVEVLGRVPLADLWEEVRRRLADDPQSPARVAPF